MRVTRSTLIATDADSRRFCRTVTVPRGQILLQCIVAFIVPPRRVELFRALSTCREQVTIAIRRPSAAPELAVSCVTRARGIQFYAIAYVPLTIVVEC
jgi:hypothetical protein